MKAIKGCCTRTIQNIILPTVLRCVCGWSQIYSAEPNTCSIGRRLVGWERNYLKLSIIAHFAEWQNDICLLSVIMYDKSNFMQSAFVKKEKFWCYIILKMMKEDVLQSLMNNISLGYKLFMTIGKCRSLWHPGSRVLIMVQYHTVWKTIVLLKEKLHNHIIQQKLSQRLCNLTT